MNLSAATAPPTPAPIAGVAMTVAGTAQGHRPETRPLEDDDGRRHSRRSPLVQALLVLTAEVV